MQSRWVGLLSCFASTLCLAQAPQNIIFGDSLSDIGNFPESPGIYWDPHQPKTLLNLVPQWYVPLSNPVNTQGYPVGTHWPTLEEAFLSPQPPIKGQARQYRSMGWTQFLVAIENPKAHIAPSMLLRTQSLPATLSINYAWAFATSAWHCVNPYYQTRMHCTAKSIEKARAQYTAAPTSGHYAAIEVPGLFQQIKLFLSDQREHRVSVTQNTRYLIWIGGNDLIVAANSLLHHADPLPFIAYLLGSTARHVIHGVSILLHYLPADKKPQTIYIFTLFNPQLTPGFYHQRFLGGLGNFSAHTSNAWLHWDVMIFNLFSKTKLVIVPINEWYATAAKNPEFSKHLGGACQLDADYAQANTAPKSNCTGYLFWNAVHPAMPMQLAVAEELGAIVNQ